MIDREELQEHLQWFLVGSLHPLFLEVACAAIGFVAAGSEEVTVVPPSRERLTRSDTARIPFGEPVSAWRLVEAWGLEEYAEREARKQQQSLPDCDTGA